MHNSKCQVKNNCVAYNKYLIINNILHRKEEMNKRENQTVKNILPGTQGKTGKNQTE